MKEDNEKKAKDYIYEAEVSDLVLLDRNGRILRGVKVIAFEMTMLAVALSIFGNAAIIGFIVAVFFLFPSPSIPCPTEYKISERGVVFIEKVLFLKKGYKLTVNTEKKFVSINNPGFRGEIIRLYTDEPKEVLEILEKLSKQAKDFI
jgi:uncharacterized membrane protein